MSAFGTRAMRPLAAAALILAAFASGCSGIGNAFRGSDNTDPPAELEPLETAVRVAVVWERDIGASAGKRYLKLHPAVADGRVYAADWKGEVNAYDVVTGDETWSVDLDTSISGGPGAGEGLVVVGTSEGEAIALSAESGTEMWRKRVPSEVLSPPIVADGVVVVRTQDGKLLGMTSRDGARLWVYDRAVPALSLRGTSSPVVAGEAVIAGFDSGLLVAVALKTGQLLWESRIAVPRGRSELERLVDIDADPVVSDTTVYVVTFQGGVAAVDLFSGKPLWRREMSSHAGLGVSRLALYVSDEDSLVWALDRDNSASIWRQDKLARRRLTRPTVFGPHVVVGDFEGYLHFLDRDDGRIVARVRLDGDGIAAAPVRVDDLLVVYGRGGTLAALKIE